MISGKKRVIVYLSVIVVAALVITPSLYMLGSRKTQVPITVSDGFNSYNWAGNFTNTINVTAWSQTYNLTTLSSTAEISDGMYPNSTLTLSIEDAYYQYDLIGANGYYAFLLNISGNLSSAVKPSDLVIKQNATGPQDSFFAFTSQLTLAKGNWSPIFNVNDTSPLRYHNLSVTSVYNKSNEYGLIEGVGFRGYSVSIPLANESNLSNSTARYHFHLSAGAQIWSMAYNVYPSNGSWTFLHLYFTVYLTGLSKPVQAQILVTQTNDDDVGG